MKAKTSSSWTSTIFIAFLAFIGIGLSAGLLGLAWPSMQKQFDLPLDGVNTIFIASTISYSLAGFFIGRLMTRFGSGTVLLVGAIIVSATIFAIAAAPSWLLVVLFSFILGFGNGFIDAGLNLYVAKYHTPQQMNFLHASFGIGITGGPLIMTFAFNQKWGWQVGYVIVAALLVILIIALAVTHNRWRNDNFLATTEDNAVKRASFGATLRKPAVWFGIITYLAYVGVEIGIGQWAYTILTESRKIPIEEAGLWVSVYWGTFTGGRILWGIIANRFKIETVLRYCMLATLIGTVLFWWQPVTIMGFIALMVIGFAQAPIFPMLMSGTAKRVGAEHAENTIGLQMGGVGIGGAILPGLIGTLGKVTNLEMMAVAFMVFAVVVFVFHELSLRPQAEKIKRVVAEEA